MKHKLTKISESKNDLIYTVEGVQDTKTLFKLIVNEALEKKLVKKSYLDAILKRENNHPTGIQASVGIAIPHADVEHAKTNALITVVSKKSIPFKMMGNPEEELDVHIIFFIISAKNDDHMQQITKIMDIVENQTEVDKLLKLNE